MGNRIAMGGRWPIDGFHFLSKNPAETPQRLAHATGYPLAVGLPPKRRHRDALAARTDSGQPSRTTDRGLGEWIGSVDVSLPPASAVVSPNLTTSLFRRADRNPADVAGD